MGTTLPMPQRGIISFRIPPIVVGYPSSRHDNASQEMPCPYPLFPARSTCAKVCAGASPGLRLFVILPLTVNVLLFFGLIWLAVGQFSGWVDTFMPSLPNWLAFLEYLLWPLFVALVVLMVFFTFTMLANIIAAPFNGFLSEKVEVVVRGEDAAPPFSWAELLAMLPRTIGRELRKLAYFAPRALALLVLSFIRC